MKPVIAMTLGDPAGIGPEIVASCIEDAVRLCRPVVFGHWPSFQAALAQAGVDVPVVLSSGSVEARPEAVVVVPCGGPPVPIDAPGPEAAAAQFACLEQAVTAVLGGLSGALVTAPVSKAAISTVCPGFLGHTEYLAMRAGLADDEVTMVFASDTLAVGLVTTHLPLRDVPAAVTPARLERTVRHVHTAARRLMTTGAPRLMVAGLNPHAGEDGLIGREEIEVMQPVIAALRCEGLDVRGPQAAEAVLRDALKGEHDGAVFGYHDQALVGLKLHGVGGSVNVTVGLPFIRTSPDHGVAYDIARRGLADPSGFRRALALAIKWIGANA